MVGWLGRVYRVCEKFSIFVKALKCFGGVFFVFSCFFFVIWFQLLSFFNFL